MACLGMDLRSPRASS